jgi:hypothetical protein
MGINMVRGGFPFSVQSSAGSVGGPQGSNLRGSGAWAEVLVAGVTIVVSRTESARYKYLRHLFGENMDVISDRRLGERRQPAHERVVTAERRHADRRRADVDKDLQALGWALVRT